MPRTSEEIAKELRAVMDEFEAGVAALDKGRKELLDSVVREAETELIKKLRADIAAKFN